MNKSNHIEQTFSIDQFDNNSIEYFNQNGFVLLRDTFTDVQIQEALNAIWQKIPEQMDEPITLRNKGSRFEKAFANTKAEWDLLSSPKLVAVIKKLRKWNRYLWHDSTGLLIVSWPEKSDWVGLHLDYFGHGSKIANGEDMIFCLIYLTDVDESCARTKVCPGSHHIIRNHLLEHPNDPQNLILYDDLTPFNLPDPIPIHAQAGDILLFDYLLAHSSGGHQKPDPRFVYRTSFHNGIGDLKNNLACIPSNVVQQMTPDQHRLAGYDPSAS